VVSEIAATIAQAVAAAETMLAGAEAAPSSALDWLTVAALRLSVGRRAAGIDALDRAVRLAPDDPDVWTARGDVLRRMGVFPLDVEAYREAARLRA
jgi:cytochrome c-type biogenesis protein CcmH/NrfG